MCTKRIIFTVLVFSFLTSLGKIALSQGTQRRPIPFYGQVFYESHVKNPPTDRWSTLITALFEHIALNCGGDTDCGADKYREKFEITVRIIRFERFERGVVENLEKERDKWDPNDPSQIEYYLKYEQMIQDILGEDGLIDGFTIYDHGRPVLFFYQVPHDPLFIHEVLHALYPAHPENIIRYYEKSFISGNSYKNLLRRAY